MHVAVGFGPKANSAGYGLRKCLLQIALAIEIAFNLVTSYADLEVMPLLAGGRRIPHPGDRRPLAFFEFPENQIVLEAISAKRQVVSVWLEVE